MRARQRRDALGVPVRVAVLGVDGRGDRANGVEQQPLDLAEQPDAMQRDAGVIADRREQLEILLAEASRAALAVDVERAEDLVGRPQRHAHHRADALADDALRRARSARPRWRRARTIDTPLAIVSVTSVRLSVNAPLTPGCAAATRRRRLRRPSLPSRRSTQRGAIGRGDFEDGLERGVRQRLQVARAGQHFGHAVQRLEMPLRALQQFAAPAAPTSPRTASRPRRARCAGG